MREIRRHGGVPFAWALGFRGDGVGDGVEAMVQAMVQQAMG